MLLIEDIEDGFAVHEDGLCAAHVAVRSSDAAWPDRARSAYLVEVNARSAAVLDAIADAARAREVYRLRVKCAARDRSLREFYESAGWRFRGIHKGAALLERVLAAEDAREPFAASNIAGPYHAMGQLPVTVLLDNVRSQYNVGSILRTADAAGISTVFLHGITPPAGKEVAKTALGAEDRVAHPRFWEAGDAIAAARRDMTELAAIETSAGAVDLFDWEPRFPVCVVFGNEIEGVSPEVLRGCDSRVRIPMLGLKHSLNVATAAGVVLFELLRKHRRVMENSR